MGWQDDLQQLVGELTSVRPSQSPTMDWARHFIPPNEPPQSSEHLTVLDPLMRPPGWAEAVSRLTGAPPDTNVEVGADPISPLPVPWHRGTRKTFPQSKS